MPPFIGVAEKLIVLPRQLGFEPLVIAIETVGETIGFIDIVIAFDVAVVGEAHCADDVITHVTI